VSDTTQEAPKETPLETPEEKIRRDGLARKLMVDITEKMLKEHVPFDVGMTALVGLFVSGAALNGVSRETCLMVVNKGFDLLERVRES
jgi:hypothetical protein